MLKRAGQVIFWKKFDSYQKLTFQHGRLPRFLSNDEERSISNGTPRESAFPRLLSPSSCVESKRQHFQIASQKKDNDLDEEKAPLDEDEKDLFHSHTELGWQFNLLETWPEYSNTVIPRLKIKSVSSEDAEKLLAADWSCMSPEEITKNFETFSHYLYEKKDDLTSVNYKQVLETLIASLEALDNSQIESVLTHLQLWGKIGTEPISTENFIEIDKKLKTRYKNGTFDNRERLRICHAIAVLRQAKKSSTFNFIMGKLVNKLKQLSYQEFIHVLILLNSNWKIPVDMYEVMHILSKHLKNINIQELSIVGLTFYKKSVQTRNSELFDTICQKAAENIDKLGSFEMAAVMKFIRSFRYHKSNHHFSNLIEKCNNVLPSVNIVTCTHVMHAMANMRVFEKKAFNLIVKRFEKEISAARLKDLERLALSLSVFNYTGQHPIHEKILDELRNPARAWEIERNKTLLGYTLMYMAQLNIYPKDLLEKVMHPSYIKYVYRNTYTMGLEYLFLDQSIEIEMPDYTGPRLGEACTNQLIRHFKKKIRTGDISGLGRALTSKEKVEMEIIMGYRKMFDESAVTMDHILPHFLHSDIILALDKNNEPLPIKEILSPLSGIKYIPENHRNGKRWIAIITGNQYSYIDGSCMSVGHTTAKMRQLSKIGYTPIMVPIDLWNNMPCTQSEYLSNLLFKNPCGK